MALDRPALLVARAQNNGSELSISHDGEVKWRAVSFADPEVFRHGDDGRRIYDSWTWRVNDAGTTFVLAIQLWPGDYQVTYRNATSTPAVLVLKGLDAGSHLDPDEGSID